MPTERQIGNPLRMKYFFDYNNFVPEENVAPLKQDLTHYAGEKSRLPSEEPDYSRLAILVSD